MPKLESVDFPNERWHEENASKNYRDAIIEQQCCDCEFLNGEICMANVQNSEQLLTIDEGLVEPLEDCQIWTEKTSEA